MTSHVNVDIFVRIMNCFIIFFWTFRTCESHFRRVSIWILRIHMSIFDYIVLDSILIVTVMSNFFEFLMKWISSYLIETNKNWCRVAHLSQSLCTRFRLLQFSFVLLFKSECSHRLRISKILYWFRIYRTSSANRHCKTDRERKTTKIFEKFLFASRTKRSFCDSSSKSSCDSEENWSLSQLFTSIFFFFADYESIAHVKSYRMLRSHRDSVKWQFDSCSYLIRCVSASWEVSVSTRLIDSYDISCENRIVIDTSSSVMRFVCSWSTSWSCSWCSKELWIDTYSRWCNHLFSLSSKWSCWLLWTSSNDRTFECMSRTEILKRLCFS
jgi:hypothetical protein